MSVYRNTNGVVAYNEYIEISQIIKYHEIVRCIDTCLFIKNMNKPNYGFLKNMKMYQAPSLYLASPRLISPQSRNTGKKNSPRRLNGGDTIICMVRVSVNDRAAQMFFSEGQMRIFFISIGPENGRIRPK